MNQPTRLGAFAIAFTLLGTSVWADVKPNGLFTSNAVLQRGMKVPIWGTARDGEKVTVKFRDQVVSTIAKNGLWRVELQAMNAGGPFELKIGGDNTIVLTNVLVGEVWLCSGQSNMGFQLSRADNAQEAISAASDPQLRLFSVPHAATDEPKTDLTGEWKPSTPTTAASFSAVAYFFGHDLRRALGVPIGLIDSSVGGTPAEAWTSASTLQTNATFRAILDRHTERVKAYNPEKAATQYKRQMEKHADAVKEAKASGKKPPRAPQKATDPARANTRPTGLYNAMIAPLQPYAIAGVIWYQGEANSGRAEEYQVLFPAMIWNWRDAWGQGNFPFLFVQIAPNDRMSPEIREAQLLTWQRVPRTAMVVTVDVGNAEDIHPTKKEPVGGRLALAARCLAYGEKLEYSGPVIAEMSLKGNQAILSFMHVGGGLVAKDGDLRGFSIAGPDEHFVDATAKIDGDKVLVSSESVPQPIAVRYGWTNAPNVNLFNKEGLPATPFRIAMKNAESTH